MTTNFPSLEALDRLTPADMTELPVEMLVHLQDELDIAAVTLKRRTGVFETELRRRYSERSAELRLARGRDTGTVHLTDGDYDIECSTTKNVSWDQTKLREALTRMDESERRFYAKVKLEVEEKKYEGAPPKARALLEPARTVKPGKENFEITLTKAAAA